jgi:signal transduction histidine kinase|tara:strand:+ start:6751 stop:7875 length:1125 start_codon:yes stop_codon:yes gene_type:complete
MGGGRPASLPPGDRDRPPWADKRYALPAVVAVLVAVSVLVIDLSLPLGVAGGVLYVALVLIGWWLPNKRYTIALAFVGSALTLVGYAFSPTGGIAWMIAVNRFLALFAIWVTALLLMEISDSAEARMAKKAAEQANRLKSDFLATMSHELRAPLNAIGGFSEMMIGQAFGPLGSPKYKEYADDIRASSEYILHLINDILDLSAIEVGKYSLVKESLIVKDVIKDCSPIIAAAASRKDIKYSIEVPENPPPLLADRRALKQILLNVLSNAVKFTPEGGRVTLKATVSDGYHVFEVSDTGEGVPEDKLPSLTDPFVRAETNPHKAQQGTGLGLAIMKSLVDIHEGELTIESEVGKGTVVTVRLPNAADGEIRGQFT